MMARSIPPPYFPAERPILSKATLIKLSQRPLPIIHRHWRQEGLYAVIVFFTSFCLYALTAPRLVALEDDALFIENLHFWGVAHPPGYPLYTLFGSLFYHLLPLSSPAFKAHLFSAFAAAGACVAIYSIVIQLLPHRLFAVLAAIAYATSKTFWSQAIIAEVYTLNTLVFFSLLAFSITYAGHQQHRPYLFFSIAAIYGLGLANHYPLLGLASVGLAFLLFSKWRQKPLNLVLGALCALLTAAPFYLWLVWRSHSDTMANFYGPIDSVEQFWFYLSRSGYASVDQQSGVTWADKLFLLRHLLTEMLWQFTPLGFILSVAGCIAMIKSRHLWSGLALLISFLGSSLVLVFLLNFKKNLLAAAVFQVYPLIAYGIMAIWLAMGSAWLVDRSKRFGANGQLVITLTLASLIIGGSIAAHWQTNNRRHYRWAHDLAMKKLDSIEENAVLFTYDDLDLPVGYLHYVEEVRPDLTIYNDQGFVFPNRLFSPLMPAEPTPQNPYATNKKQILQDFVHRETRPIYYHTSRFKIFSTPTYGSVSRGFYRQVRRDGAGERVILHDSVRQWLDANLQETLTTHDLWTIFQRYELMAVLLSNVQLWLLNNEGTPEWKDILKRGREQNAKARVLTDLIRLRDMSEAEQRQEAAWLASLNLNEDEPEMDRFGRGRVYLLQAQLAANLEGPDSPLYENSLKKALAEDSRTSNPGLFWLLSFYVQNQQRHCDYLSLVDRFYPDINKAPNQLRQQTKIIRQQSRCF